MTQEPEGSRGDPGEPSSLGESRPSDQASWGQWAAPLSAGEAEATSSPESQGAASEATQAYSPIPEPRGEWARVAAGAPEPVTPEGWFEQPVTRVASAPAAPSRGWPVALLLLSALAVALDDVWDRVRAAHEEFLKTQAAILKQTTLAQLVDSGQPLQYVI